MELNGELEITCPEGFREMDASERAGLQFLEDRPGVCLNDAQRHMIVTVGWKKPNLLLRLLLNGKDIAKGMEANIWKAMRPYGYRLEGYTLRRPGDREAHGVRFTYTAQGVDMYSESCVVKYHDTLYYFNLYTRTERKAENLGVWEQLLNSAVWH